MSERTNQDVAIDVSLKFAFYFVALTFTILGLALQSGEFDGNGSRDLLEASSWLALLVSGLAGLWRLEYLNVLYRIRHAVDSETPHPGDQTNLARLERGSLIKYSIQRWAFAFGMAALVAARAWGHYNMKY